MTPESTCSNKTPPEIDMGRNRTYTVAHIYIYIYIYICVCVCVCVCVNSVTTKVLILFTSEVYVMIFLTHH